VKVTLQALASRLAQEARAFRGLLVLCVCYWLCKLVFFHVSRRYGLLQGVSPANLGALTLGVLLLALRFLVLFYLPIRVVYRIGKRLLPMSK
jgi:hypothetical protein